MESKYTEFFEIIPKHALLPIIQVVPSKFKRIDTSLLSYVFVQNGVIKKIVSDNLKECASRIIKQQLKPVSNKSGLQIQDMELSDECKILLNNFLFFKRKYESIINSDILTSYISYLLISDTKLDSYKFFDDCLYVNEKLKVKSDLLSSITTCIGNEVSTKLCEFGKYLTTPLEYIEYKCYGREKEIEESINVLSRLKKSNVLLCGNTGVGKTSVVYGICNYLQSEKCPENLLKYNVFELSVNKIMSGTTFRGDLEKRLDEIISELHKYNNTIVFIDEIHSILSKSGSDESSTLQNVLKPYLSENSKVIGCTTEQEYKLIEKDKAFERRFSTINIRELSCQETIETLLSSKEDYEKHHNVTISDDSIKYIVKMCNSNIKNRYFPDKAFDILDSSCVYSRTNNRELCYGDIDRAIFDMCGLNTIKPTNSDIESFCNSIKNDILGQDEAINVMCKCFKKYYAGLCDKTKPIGNYLFVGPTGVGKTELCKKLCEYFFTSESFIRFDMSEFMEKHTISKLIGSPPGYVGYYSGGSLTERVKHRPFSIVLFDEIEKAHPDVVNILLQIMDDGRLTDSFGNTVDFCNCLIVMTSNLGCKEYLESKSIGFETYQDKSVLTKSIKNFFSPEFINRLDDIVYFNKIDKNIHSNLVDKYIDEYVVKIEEIGKKLFIEEKVITKLKNISFDDKYGARYIKKKIFSILDNIVLENIYNSDNITIDKIVDM